MCDAPDGLAVARRRRIALSWALWTSEEVFLEAHERMRQAREALRTWVGTTDITCGLLFLELAFKTSTTGDFWPSTPVIVLFSCAIGQLLGLACSLARTERANRIARTCVLAVLGVLFSVEYFVYCQFKLFYDPTTVLSGASDVAGQFGGEAASLVFSPDGLFHVALFLLPAVAYLLLAHADCLAPASRVSRRQAAGSAGAAVGAHVLALVLTASLGPLGALYDSQYSFQTGVQSFGLVTCLRKELLAHAGGQNASFDLDAEEAAPTRSAVSPQDDEPAQDEPEEAAPKPAVRDIDFDALAASTDNETWANLDRYVGSLTPSMTNEYTGLFKGMNLIFISAEAFTAEVIRPDITPTLYKMWDEGIQLTDFYQFDTAGTTGGECANLFGLLATEGGSSVKATATYNNRLTLGNMLNRRGYEGWAFHNNTYTYYGRDATHNNLGYNHGYMGYGNGMEQWVTWQWPQSDLEMIQGTFDNLYGSERPFNVYYMSVSGHSDYGPGENMMAEKNADVVADLPYSDRVKNYLAANVELDRAMEWLLQRLRDEHIYRKTVIVISADHFPYGLDDDAALGQLPYLSELYGYDVTNVFQRDHNRPIIWCGALPKQGLHIRVDEPTMSIDLLPTLCNLFALKWDSRLLPGRDVLDPTTEGLAFNLSYDWRTSLGTYWAGSGSFEPAEGAEVPEGYVETMNAVVANKISYCHGVLTSDYYRHVFGEPKDVQKAHDRGVRRRMEREQRKAAAGS